MPRGHRDVQGANTKGKIQSPHARNLSQELEEKKAIVDENAIKVQPPLLSCHLGRQLIGNTIAVSGSRIDRYHQRKD